MKPHTPSSQHSVSLTLSEISRIHSIVWFFISVQNQILSPSSNATPGRTAMLHEVSLNDTRGAVECWLWKLCHLALSFPHNYNEQPYGQMLSNRSQKSNWSMKSLRWQILNARFLIHYSTIVGNNYPRNFGLRQLVAEAQLVKTYSNTDCVRRGALLATNLDVGNLKSVYPCLGLKPLPKALLIWLTLWMSLNERCIASLTIYKWSSKWNSAYA